ncbi:glutamate formimidoyltransferase [Candidatus Marinimicrobia bacterium]|nr:glutamate formimidoyltransferase [Candidatus Neomarinimicrobiota bacterium]
MKLIECVPNFSEGRNKDFIFNLELIIKSNSSVHLLDIDPGYDTNRTVVTFVGKPFDVIDVAYELIKYASINIDMRNHKGEHPRMGATDVCPLVPIKGVSMSECVELSKELAEKVSSKLNIPIFLYENSATNSERTSLSNIRSGEYEEMQDKIKNNFLPDYGKKFNLKSGVTAIGAREFLIAYNINLNTTDKKIATDIALDIREAGRLKRDKDGIILRDKNGLGIKKPGKLKYCKAVGWYIDEYKQAQVSINLINFNKTSIHRTFEEVRAQARKRGVRVTGSEIVGLMPQKAIIETGKFYLQKQKRSIGVPDSDIISTAIKSLGLNDISIFNPNKKIIEICIQTKENSLNTLSIEQFSHEVSRDSFAPGGGSVSALMGALAASLTAMVSNLTLINKKYKNTFSFHEGSSVRSQSLLKSLIDLVNEDSKAYNNIITARRLPKKTENQISVRNNEILKATKYATDVPFAILRNCSLISTECLNVCRKSNISSISDIGVASHSLKSASYGAYYNVLINLPDLKSEDQKKYIEESELYIKNIDENHITIKNFVESILKKNK